MKYESKLRSNSRKSEQGAEPRLKTNHLATRQRMQRKLQPIFKSRLVLSQFPSSEGATHIGVGPLLSMFVHILEENSHRSTISNISLIRVARAASQHTTHSAFSINHERARISLSQELRERFVEGNDGPFLGHGGADVVEEVGTYVRVNLVSNAASQPGSTAFLENQKGRSVVLFECLEVSHLFKENSNVLNIPLTAGRIDEFVWVLNVGFQGFLQLL